MSRCRPSTSPAIRRPRPRSAPDARRPQSRCGSIARRLAGPTGPNGSPQCPAQSTSNQRRIRPGSHTGLTRSRICRGRPVPTWLPRRRRPRGGLVAFRSRLGAGQNRRRDHRTRAGWPPIRSALRLRLARRLRHCRSRRRAWAPGIALRPRPGRARRCPPRCRPQPQCQPRGRAQGQRRPLAHQVAARRPRQPRHGLPRRRRHQPPFRRPPRAALRRLRLVRRLRPVRRLPPTWQPPHRWARPTQRPRPVLTIRSRSCPASRAITWRTAS